MAKSGLSAFPTSSINLQITNWESVCFFEHEKKRRKPKTKARLKCLQILYRAVTNIKSKKKS